MKRFMLESVVALLLMGGTAEAACLYQGVPYSEGARVCMHRTMFMCRGKQWKKTAERCWEGYTVQESSLRRADQGPLDAPARGHHRITIDNAIAPQEKSESPNCALTE
jgi:hypothetical protein